MQRTVESLALLSLAAALVACGGGQSAPKQPTTQETESEQTESSAGASDGDASDAEEPEEAAEETTEESSHRDRSPKQILTAEGVLFAFSFNASEAYQGAEQKCSAKAGEDPQKKAECMRKMHDQFDADGMAFQKDDEDKWWWLTIRRRGNSATALHKIEIEFGEETDDGIKILPKGRDKGSKPMARIPKEVTIGVPNDSEIFLIDPKHGKMVYQAKMGLIGQGER